VFGYWQQQWFVFYTCVKSRDEVGPPDCYSNLQWQNCVLELLLSDGDFVVMRWRCEWHDGDGNDGLLSPAFTGLVRSLGLTAGRHSSLFSWPVR
jgi:hypothetical protein